MVKKIGIKSNIVDSKGLEDTIFEIKSPSDTEIKNICTFNTKKIQIQNNRRFESKFHKINRKKNHKMFIKKCAFLLPQNIVILKSKTILCVLIKLLILTSLK